MHSNVYTPTYLKSHTEIQDVYAKLTGKSQQQVGENAFPRLLIEDNGS